MYAYLYVPVSLCPYASVYVCRSRLEWHNLLNLYNVIMAFLCSSRFGEARALTPRVTSIPPFIATGSYHWHVFIILTIIFGYCFDKNL